MCTEVEYNFFLGLEHCAGDPSSGPPGFLMCFDLSTALFIHFFQYWTDKNRKEEDFRLSLNGVTGKAGWSQQNMCLKYPERKEKVQRFPKNAS